MTELAEVAMANPNCALHSALFDRDTYPMRSERAQKKTAREQAPGLSMTELAVNDRTDPEGSILHVQFRTTVLRATFRIVAAVSIGVRRDRTGFAVTVRASQAGGIDTVAGQVVIHSLGA